MLSIPKIKCSDFLVDIEIFCSLKEKILSLTSLPESLGADFFEKTILTRYDT